MTCSPAHHSVLKSLVEEQLQSPFYPGSMWNEPHLIVLECRPDEQGLVRVDFMGHHVLYMFAQSGSDWGSHTILQGRATFREDQLVHHEVQVVVETSLTERDFETYDHNAQFDDQVKRARLHLQHS